MYVCTCVCVYVCLFVCMYVCMYVCICFVFFCVLTRAPGTTRGNLEVQRTRGHACHAYRVHNFKTREIREKPKNTPRLEFRQGVGLCDCSFLFRLLFGACRMQSLPRWSPTKVLTRWLWPSLSWHETFRGIKRPGVGIEPTHSRASRGTQLTTV